MKVATSAYPLSALSSWSEWFEDVTSRMGTSIVVAEGEDFWFGFAFAFPKQQL